MSEAVKVMVRVRPMSEGEKNRGCKNNIDIDEKTHSLVLHKKDDPDGSKQFTFDHVFSASSTQEYIYEQTAFPLVESVVEGYNGTIFAYGQTGCGKTFSMIGDTSSPENKGIIPRAFQHIVKIISTCSTNLRYLVRCSYLEIYNEEIHDLVGKDVKARLEMKESYDKGVFIKDLSLYIVKSVEDMEKLMNYGNKNRAVGETQMNKDSSRSHSVFTVYVECGEGADNQRLTAGKLHLVDLAGSERQSKTQATGDRLKEGAKINLSLSALGNVISALVDGKTAHIPYRDSKLTRLLMDSLGGNTKTIMIAAASPADYNFEETLSTLRYASRAKNIQNKPKVNEDPKDALLKEYADEIKKLKDLLQQTQQQSQLQGKPPLPQGTPQQVNTKGKQTKGNSNQNDQNTDVTSTKTIEELKKLQEMNSRLSKQQEQWESQIKEKELKMNQEKSQREKLEQLLKDLESRAIQGGQANDEEKKKFKKLQSQLKKQQKEADNLIQEKKQKEDELMLIEKNYQSLQEEIDSLRNLVLKIRKKYKQALEEIGDLQKEYEENKEDLLDTIRFQEKEVKLYKGIAKMLLNADELFSVKEQCSWNPEKNDYNIVPFYLKDKELKFPKLPGNQALDMVENEKEVRSLVFTKNQSTKIGKANSVDRDSYNRIDDNQINSNFKESNLSYVSRGKAPQKNNQLTKLQPLNYEPDIQQPLATQNTQNTFSKKKFKLDPLYGTEND